MKDAFSSYHPVINILYFALVLTFSLGFMHPICLGCSAISAVAYRIYLGGREVKRFFLLLMPFIFMAIVLNPIFSHEGETILIYLPSGNPLTLESIVYGLASAVLLFAIVAWFACLNEVITTDKIVYLFGRIIPALSLVLSMSLRFIPRFYAQIKLVDEANRGLNIKNNVKGLKRQVRNGIAVFSCVVSWSLENAIETADSMKSRGYGISGRTTFAIYCWAERDKYVLVWLLFCGFYLITGWLAGGLQFCYYPKLKGVSLTAFPISFLLVYLALCLTPLLIDLEEDRKWKYMR